MIVKAEEFDFYHSFKGESKLKGIGIIAAFLFSFATVFTSMAAWVTHVIVCIKSTSWILLVFGIVVPPIGIIHGIGSWFGLFA